MDHKKLNRAVAAGVFLASLATYVTTLSPTVAFWDVGEFCAAAFSLQIPHPPGAPLFLLLGRLASLVPVVPDIAARMHLLSALASALTCAFLYLLSVRFIVSWRGVPATAHDRIVVYGSALIGSLSLAFSPTFWSSAVETEVYGLSMLFVSGTLLLGARWYEHADDPRGDGYLLLIAYAVGLSASVHFMAILVLFPLMLFYYFRFYEFSIVSFAKFGFTALIGFGIVYPGIVKVLPSLLDGEVAGIDSELIAFVPLLLIAAALYGVYYSIRHQNRFLQMALMGLLLIVLGFSTYTLVYIRANATPPMNQNDPSTMTKFVSYLNREMYGAEPISDRRWNKEPVHAAAAAKYTSDFDYFWKYQLVHMYLRYLGWNYAGSEGDWKDAGVDWKKLYGIPLFFGLLGAFYHWRKDPKMAAVATATFLVLGLALIINRNFQEPQVRERDYFYVGSFFVFSMWIGIGVLGLLDWIRKKFRPEGRVAFAGYGVLALAFIVVPLNMLRSNFHQANRNGSYVAWDYSYNVLQTCDQDAILITNGDNDTFPLWYLQDVEGIRRDVRVVSLSLLNMSWYVRQLRNSEPYGARKVPITTPDAEIENLSYREFQPGIVKLPVPREAMRRYGAEGTTARRNSNSTAGEPVDTISFFMPHTIEVGTVKALRAQDIVLFDLVASTRWQRPIYFAMTVPADGQIGLKDYLQLEGLAFRLTPKKGTSPWSNLNESRLRAQLFTNAEAAAKTPSVGFRWRGLQDSTISHDENVRGLVNNCRQSFILLTRHNLDTPGMAAKATEVLDRMEQLLPRNVVEMDYRTMMYVASLYNTGGNKSAFDRICNEIVTALKPIVRQGVGGPLTSDNPHVLLLQTYEMMGQFDDALNLVDVIGSRYANETNIDLIVSQTREALLAEKAAALQRDSLAAAAPAKGK